jgi:hypothetical protein
MKRTYRVLSVCVTGSLLLLLVTGTIASPRLPGASLPRLHASSGMKAEIVAPSTISGEDFATTVVGNPWDMDGTDDIDDQWTTHDPGLSLGERLTYRASDGILTITTNDTGGGCSPPWPHRPLALNLGGHRIDEQKFKYFTFRYKMDSPINLPCGSVSKIRWMDYDIWAEGRTQDIFLFDNDWHTYSVDLSTAIPAKGAEWPGVQWNVLQIMVHESHWAWTSRLDWARLTAENTAEDTYTVRWNLIDGSDVLTTTIYWATDRSVSAVLPGTGHVVSPTPGTSPTLPYDHHLFLPLALKNYHPASELDAEFAHTVSTAGLTSGESYYIAIKLEDGTNVVWSFSEVPVIKL